MFLVRARSEAEARRTAEAIVTDEDHDRMWSDEDLIDHDEVEATKVFLVEPVSEINGNGRCLPPGEEGRRA